MDPIGSNTYLTDFSDIKEYSEEQVKKMTFTAEKLNAIGNNAPLIDKSEIIKSLEDAIELESIGKTEEKTFTAEKIDINVKVQKLLELIKSNPEAMEKLLENVDPSNPEDQAALELLEMDLSSSQVLTSDNEKGNQWLKERLGEVEKVEAVDDIKTSSSWRWYHYVTVPAKYSWKGGKFVWKGYRFISNALVPVGVLVLSLYSPWLPILRTLLRLLI